MVHATEAAREALLEDEALVFDWHRVAICCACAGEVSLRRDSRRGSRSPRRSGELEGDAPVYAHRMAYPHLVSRDVTIDCRRLVGGAASSSDLPPDFGLRAASAGFRTKLASAQASALRMPDAYATSTTSAAPVSAGRAAREQPAAAAAVVQRPHQLDQAAGAGRALRVAVDQAAAERVHRVDVGAGLAREPEVVDRERVVGLDHVDVGDRQARVGERGGRGRDRRLRHLAARHAREAGREDARRRAGRGVRRDDQARAAVGGMGLRAVGRDAALVHRRQAFAASPAAPGGCPSRRRSRSACAWSRR